MKKYQLLDTELNYEGIPLKLIEYLIDIPTKNVKAGDYGGYIENENNLSHSGTSVVMNNARVVGNAVVCGDATVLYYAIIQDNAVVMDDALVTQNAIICEDAKIENKASVKDSVEVKGTSIVKGIAELSGRALVKGNSYLNDAKVGGNSFLKNSSVIGENTVVADAYIEASSINDNSKIEGKVNIRHSTLTGVNVFDFVEIAFSQITGRDITLKEKASFRNVRLHNLVSVLIAGNTYLEKATFEQTSNTCML